MNCRWFDCHRRLGPVAVLLWVCGAVWGVPGVINYHAKLTDGGGQPLSGALTISFTFWDAESGGNLLAGFIDTDVVTPDAEGVVSAEVGDSPGVPVPAVIFGGGRLG